MSEAPSDERAPDTPSSSDAPSPPTSSPDAPADGTPSAPGRRWIALRRIDPWSAGKVQGVLGVATGVLIGVIYGIGFLIMGAVQGEPGMAVAGLGIMVGAPVLNGVMSLLFGALFAWLYGIVADWVGPVRWEIEFE